LLAAADWLVAGLLLVGCLAGWAGLAGLVLLLVGRGGVDWLWLTVSG